MKRFYRLAVWVSLLLTHGQVGAATDSRLEVAGPLSPERITEASRMAGFRVKDIKTDIPHAIRPRIPVPVPSVNDENLEKLRRRYALDQVVALGHDEWSRQLLLKEWVHQAIPGGTPKTSYDSAWDILEHASLGDQFWCTQYTITYAECALALGWQARKLGIDRQHGSEANGSDHHGVAEVWSNQFGKWVVIDAQSNLHFEKAGIPLSAWEIRAQWLKEGGKSVDHVVGVPPKTVKKNPAILWWNRQEDETSVYFWIYLEDRVMAKQAPDGPTQLILPEDKWNENLIWYQNGEPGSESGVLHQGYLKNRFHPTRRIEDVYWTVGLTEASISGVSGQSILLNLDSYCPNRMGYEVSTDGENWSRVKDERRVLWPLQLNWNSIRIRTLSQGHVRGPITSVLMFLEPLVKN